MDALTVQSGKPSGSVCVCGGGRGGVGGLGSFLGGLAEW